jgi:hypothetical protein
MAQFKLARQFHAKNSIPKGHGNISPNNIYLILIFIIINIILIKKVLLLFVQLVPLQLTCITLCVLNLVLVVDMEIILLKLVKNVQYNALFALISIHASCTDFNTCTSCD